MTNKQSRSKTKVAALVHRRFELEIVVGVAAAPVHPDPVYHCFNLDSQGEVVDAATAVRGEASYLGRVLSSSDEHFVPRMLAA